ncbi:MAG: CBF/Mak21 family-domain-containing protein [Benjaminiella poitrasii]|nr:MAG: CBF/Mak21 family-domain-containing protein [Benjaminiella poitrasii]
MAPKKSVQRKTNNTSSKVMNKAASKSKKGQATNLANSQKKGKKGKDQKDKDKVPEYVNVPNQDDDDLVVSEDDLEFFSENKGFTSFLTSLDSKELTKNLTKKKKVPAKKVVQQQNEGLDSSSEEEFDSDEDLDNFEELSNDEEEEELDLDDEDQMEQLLAEAEEEKKSNGKSKKKSTTSNESDEEMEYELKPRKVANEWTKKDFHNKLPIKLPGGKITQVEEDLKEDEEDAEAASDIEQEESDEVAEEQEKEEEEVVEEEPKLTKREYLIKMKEELATLASDLQADPEENISLLKKFRDIYKNEENNATIKKLALLTQLAVYKDIIPGYRIRPLTALEEQTQVSKEVKKMREYEKTLLNNYEAYLKDLNALLTKKKSEEDASMALVATRCLCELLTSKTHFNFRLEIMVAVVTRMSSVKWNDAAQLCSEALVTVFENDESGKASLDAVKMIIRMVKSKGFVINENVINIFLHLRLRDEMAPAYAKKDDDEKVGKKRKNNNKPFLTKKARKTLKETKEIEKEFQEAEAVVSKEEKEKNHTETLKLMFAFYFRILKKQTSSPLLPAVLEGLSLFAHLISVDFFDDLLNALREVMQSFEDSNVISRTSSGTRKRLLCIITAFQLLSGQGEALNYDLKEFYKEIYKILFKATFHTKIEEKPDSQKETESEMLLKGLELMFLKKRQVPVNRLAAFIKRFALVALHMPNKTVLQCLALVNRLVQKDHRLDALLQSEDRASSGVYAPLLEDPELCNPFGTSLYELFLYQNHYDPQVRNLAKALQHSA